MYMPTISCATVSTTECYKHVTKFSENSELRSGLFLWCNVLINVYYIVYDIITCIFTSDSVIHENFDKIFPQPSSYLCIAENFGGIIDIRQCGKDCHIISSMQSLTTHAGQKISVIKSLPMRAGVEITRLVIFMMSFK